MEFLKSTAGKVVSGMVGLVVVAAAISWWRMDVATRDSILWLVGRVAAWFLIVLLVPWATFFIIARVARMSSNLAGGLLVAGYTVVELLLLLWLVNWSAPGTVAKSFIAVGVLFAAVYNLFTCDWIAEKV